MNLRPLWLARSLWVLALLPGLGRAQGPRPESDRPTLNILAGGINTRGSDMYADFATTRDLGVVYKIEIVGESYGEPNRRPGFGNYAPVLGDWPGLVNYVRDRDDAEAGIKRVRVSSPADPRLAPFLHEIARQKHATVMIDMDLFLFGKEKWKTQTDKLAWIAASVAQERLRQEPRSENTFLAHSAGTWGLSSTFANSKL